MVESVSPTAAPWPATPDALLKHLRALAQTCKDRIDMPDPALALLGLPFDASARIENAARASILENVADQLERVLIVPAHCDGWLDINGGRNVCELLPGHEGSHQKTLLARHGLDRTDVKLVWSTAPYLQKVP